MGIPAFFRWLQMKYPKVVEQVGVNNLDAETRRNLWCDNLYLDMNGIIHPCSHPEDKAPPTNEKEMFEAIFEYMEMIMQMIKPRRLLYMAVDGVAPRAKMNQQRSRRFRSAQENEIKQNSINQIRANLRSQNIEPTESQVPVFDSNVITPGTEFMLRLSKALQKWIIEKLKNHKDPNSVWHKNLKVILSDASVPGEGEHKIMDYLREQKTKPTYDTSIRHCLLGADADLIMLGLATHERHFTILREEFKPNQQRPCDICKCYGHRMEDCQGIMSMERGQNIVSGNKTDFIYIRLARLRDELYQEMKRDSYINLEFERYLDDFIFLCFFVGNDFLPHLPCLEIRERAVDTLIRIYHRLNRSYWRPGLYLNNKGFVNLDRCQEILHELGGEETTILLRRKSNEEKYQGRQRQNKKTKWQRENNNFNDRDYPEPSPPPEDELRLGEPGWKERYYVSKFGCPVDDYHVVSDILAREYARGLCWVLGYYFNGCPDWQWFYPFHYAPFAQDMRAIMKINLNFDKLAKPFSPLEQLMCVLPERSADALPPSWRRLMSDVTSPIIDFYPSNFKIDLNGKTAAWMGVALLPFIDEKRLFRALESVYPDLTDEERKRNSSGGEMLFSP